MDYVDYPSVLMRVLLALYVYIVCLPSRDITQLYAYLKLTAIATVLLLQPIDL